MLLRSKSRVYIFALLLGWTWSLPVASAPAKEARKPVATQNRIIKVGFSQDTLANEWRLAQVNDLKRELSRIPQVELVVTDGKGSTPQQIRDIEDLTDSGIDILIANPRDGKAMAPALARAYRKRIPVILLTRLSRGTQYTTLVAPDDKAIGRDAALHLKKVLRGKGRILIFQGEPTTSTAKDLTASFLKELKRHRNLEVAAVKVGNELRADAVRGMEEVLKEKIDFDAIFAQSDSMAIGARRAMKAAGISPRKIPIVGIGYDTEARLAIRRGEESASFTYPTCAKEVADVVTRLLDGKRVPKRITVPSRKVTALDVNKITPVF